MEFRCRKCGHLLAKEEILFGTLEIKCYSCNELNFLDYDFKELNNVVRFPSMFTTEANVN